MEQQNKNYDEELEQPLLVEESFTFDDKEGLKSTDLSRHVESINLYSQ